MMRYRVNNRRIEVDCSDDGTYADFSENVYISEVLKDLISGKESVIVTIEHENGEDELVELSHQAIGSRIISELAAFGYTCVDNRENSGFIQLILLESKKAVTQKRYFHKRLGFVKKKNGDELFLLHKPIGEKNILRSSSTYFDEVYTKPRGCLVGWKNAVRKYVYGRGHMELALAIGAVAPIAHILLEEKIVELMPVIGIIGGSTSGKTTSLILQSSIWFSQEMISDFNCTPNAFVTQLSESRGVAMLIDEASAVADWDFTNLLYNIPKGKSKARCKADGSKQKRLRFSGAVVLTGERSLFKQTTGTRGLEARLFELTLPWTESAEHAEDIVREFSRHYGVAAPHLMQWILANRSQLKQIYCKYLAELKTRCSAFELDAVHTRLLNIPALIVTAAEVLNSSLSLKLNIETVITTLVEVMRKKAENVKESPEYWREKLLSFVSDNAGKFPDRGKVPDAHKIWGFKDYLHLAEVMWIRSDIYEKAIADICNVDLKDANWQLAEKKYIVRDDDRHYKFGKRIRGAALQCYGLFLNNPPKKKRKVNINYNKKKSLLED